MPFISNKLLVFSCILYLILVSDGFAKDLPKIRMDQAFTSQNLGPAMEYLVDAEGSLSIDALLDTTVEREWQITTKSVPNFGYLPDKGAVWGRFLIASGAQAPARLILESSYPLLDRIKVFVIRQGHITEMVAGDHVPRKDWPIDQRWSAFPIEVDQETEVYIQVSGTAAIQFSFDLYASEYYSAYRLKRECIQALYYGAVLSIIIYNLFVGIGAGIRTYLYYVVFLLANVAFQLAYSGYAASLFWPSLTAKILDYSIFPPITLIAFFSHVFSAHLLGVDLTSMRYKIYSYIFIGSACIISLCFITLPLKFTVISVLLTTVLPWALILISYSVDAFKRKEKVAIPYSIAWLIFIVGTLCVPLKTLGLIPVNVFTDNLLQIGSAIEFILLSFALAYRIKGLESSLNSERIEKERLRAEYQENLLMEVETRFQLSSDAAHHINNPLNHIQLALQSLEHAQSRIKDLTFNLIGENAAEDREMAIIYSEYVQQFDLMQTANQVIAKAGKRIEGTVSEIRFLSGIDGYARNHVSITDLVAATRENIEEFGSGMTVKKVRPFVITQDPISVYSNIAVLSHVLSRFILFLAEKVENDLEIEFASKGAEGDFSIFARGLFQLEEQLLGKIERKMAYTLVKFGGSVQLKYVSNQLIHLSYQDISLNAPKMAALELNVKIH